MIIYEYWAIDKDGNKHNATVKSKSTRPPKKVRRDIQQKVKFDIGQCKDFGFRALN